MNTTSNLIAQDPSTGAVHSGPARHTGGAHPTGGAPQPRAHTGGPLPGDRRTGVRAGAPLAGLRKEARRPGGAPGAAPQGGAGTGEPRPRIPLWSSTTGAQQKTGIRIFHT